MLHIDYNHWTLDVGLFSPLSKAYSKELSDFMMKGQGFISMTKRMFYPFFKKAWEASFTEANIESAWRATGIWPYNPEKTLSICSKKPPSTPAKKSHVRFAPKTPLSNHAMRQLAKEGHLNARDSYIQAMLRESEQMAAKVDCLEFENKGLLEALKAEKKKRNRGKRLNLLGEEDNGPQLFSPSKIQAAREYAQGKEAEKEQHKRDAEEKRREQQRKKVQGEIEKKARADARFALRIVRQEEVLKKRDLAVQKKAEREAKKAQLAAEKLASQVNKNSPGGVQKSRKYY